MEYGIPRLRAGVNFIENGINQNTIPRMKQQYLAPESEVIRLESPGPLCLSGQDTEKYYTSGNSYDDDDFS